MATSEGIPSSIDIEFLELNDNPYYNGTWNRGDLVRGCLAVGVGMGLRYWAFGLL